MEERLRDKVALVTGGASKLDEATVLLRWGSFAPNLELITSENSLHQNIAIGRLEKNCAKS